MGDQLYFVYMLRCADGTFYVGVALDPSLRLGEHRQGLDPFAYTYRRRPVELVWAESFQDYEEALAAERQIKGWSHAKKAALIEGGLDAVHAIVKQQRRRREAGRKARAERSHPVGWRSRSVDSEVDSPPE